MFLRSTPLPDGRRVRVRLPHGSDRTGLRDLHARTGTAVDDLGLTRLLRVDPRRRCALVATAWVAGGERVVGFAACDVPPRDEALVLADPEFGDALRDLLADQLRRRTSRVA